MTQINVNSFDRLTPLWKFGGSTCTLKLYYTKEFVDSGNNIVLKGSLDNPHQSITCTIASQVITIPPITITSTEDGTPSTSSLTGVFFDTTGTRRLTFFSKFRIPVTTPTTWPALFIHNQPSIVLPDEYYTKTQVELLIDQEIAAATASFVTLYNTYGNSLVTAIAAIGSTPTTLIIDQDTSLTSSVIIPSTLVLDFRGEARIVSNGSGAIEFQGVGLANSEVPVPIFEGFDVGDIQWTSLEWPSKISIELWDTLNDSLNERINLADAAVATLSDTFVAGDVNTTTNVITLTAHPFETGMLVVPSTTGTFPTTSPADYLYADVPVYIIKVDANSVKLAYTYDEAFAGTAIDLTSGGSGTHTLARYTTCTLICHPRTITNPGSVISEYHTLLFTEGNYQSEFNTWGTTYFAAFELKDNTTMTAEGHAVLCESPIDGNGNLIQAFHLRFGAGTSDKTCKNIIVEKLHLLGNPNQVEISGGHATVLLGNCTNGFIRFNTFERLKAYAAGLGGGGVDGNYARDSGVHHNMFIGCEAQNAFIINGDSCFISNNYFDVRGAAGGLVIDVEPNQNNVSTNITVENNTIDTSKSSGSWGGIGIQCAGATSAQGAICRNNTILGRDISTAAGLGALATGLFIVGSNASVVANNVVRAASSRGALFWGCRNVDISGNHFIHCLDGSGNDASFELLDSNDCHVYNNINSQSALMPSTASTAIYEQDLPYPATSSGSVVAMETVGGYRFYTHQVGLQVLFNATLYTISNVDISVYPHLITMTAAVGTVGVASVPSSTDVDTGASKIIETGHPYNNGCRLRYAQGTVAIGGLTNGADYYVVNKTANDFQLAATVGGAPIALTTTGTGTQTFTPIMEARFSANTYFGNDAAKGYVLSATGTSEITSTAKDRLLTTVADTNYTATTASGIILYTSLTAGRTVSLPDATRCKGKEIVVKDGAGAAAANNITLDGNGAQTIDGAATYAINSNWGKVIVKSNGTNWNTV